MRLLLDSSGAQLVCALADNAGVKTERLLLTGSPESRDIGKVAAEILDGLSCADLDSAVIGLGPGSFIGTRIALSYANGLAAAGGLKLYGVDSLAAIGAVHSQGRSVVLRDARRGEYYMYGPSGEHAESRLLALAELAAELRRLGITHAAIEEPAANQTRAQTTHEQALAILAQAGVSVARAVGVPAEGLRRLGHGTPVSYLEPPYLRGFL